MPVEPSAKQLCPLATLNHGDVREAGVVRLKTHNIAYCERPSIDCTQSGGLLGKRSPDRGIAKGQPKGNMPYLSCFCSCVVPCGVACSLPVLAATQAAPESELSAISARYAGGRTGGPGPAPHLPSPAAVSASSDADLHSVVG